jgi:hypothetical protein
MAYSVDTYSGGRTLVVEDGTVNNELDIRLVGKNFSGYGEIQNENLLHLLENFAGLTPPPKPVNGQIWFDAMSKKIKFWDQASVKWKTTGSIESSVSSPRGAASGDLWWDEKNKQLYAFDGVTHVLIGPQSVPGVGTTQMKTLVVRDVQNNTHGIIAAFVNGKVMYIISRDPTFELDNVSKVTLGAPDDFNKVYPGITITGTLENGVTSSAVNSIIWGTASSSLGLVDSDTGELLSSSDFLRSDVNLNSFNEKVIFGNEGYTLGDREQLQVRISENPLEPDVPVIRNRVGNTIKLQTTISGVGVRTPLVLVGNNVLPGENNATDLGSPSQSFKDIYANKFYGDGSQLININVAGFAGTLPSNKLSGSYDIDISGSSASSVNANKLLSGSSYVSSAVDTAYTGTPSTVAVRDLSGNLNAVLFQGTATQALFADLAEKYLTDKPYEVGTVVAVGGTAEVTACTLGDRAFGAVSANPAYMMNAGLEGGTYIALKGRLPIKVVGPVKKGDALLAANDGCVSSKEIVLKDKVTPFDTFAVSLETNDDPGVKLVEAIIL